MGSYEPRYTDDEIASYVPDHKDVSELSDYEREEIERQKTRDDYLEDEWYKEDSDE